VLGFYSSTGTVITKSIYETHVTRFTAGKYNGYHYDTSQLTVAITTVEYEVLA
jgi:hypothetical protein